MNRASFFALDFLVILGLSGCSINVGGPAMPSPTLSPHDKTGQYSNPFVANNKRSNYMDQPESNGEIGLHQFGHCGQ